MSMIPPPPTVPPRGPNVPLIVGVLLGVFGLGACALVLMGLALYGRLTSAPPKRPGYGHPVVLRDLGDGWKHYSFRDLNMEVSLNEAPRPASRPWRPDEKLSVTDWTFYQSEGNPLFVDLSGFWLTRTVPGGSKAYADGYLYSLRTSSEISQVRGMVGECTVDGHKAAELIASYVQGGYRVQARCLYFYQPGSVRAVRVTWYELAPSGSESWDRVLSSIKFND